MRCAAFRRRTSRPQPRSATAAPFLERTIRRFGRLRAILALGRIAHHSALRALGARPADVPFAHGGWHDVGGVRLFASYHCSRYNTNTGRLTAAMFAQVVAGIAGNLSE